ncbi:MAG: hypothetical protein U0U67_04180 [Chitinophagales bacterium]
MRDSKLFAIIYQLSDKEIALIKKKLKQEAGKYAFSLFVIFIELKQTEISKEEIFYRVFKKKYTKNNDMQLRNEMKRLIDKIEKICVLQMIQDDIRQNEVLQLNYKLQWYKKLSLTDEFSTVLDQISIQLKNTENYSELFNTHFSFVDLLRNLNANLRYNAIQVAAIYEQCEAAFYKSTTIAYKKLLYLKRYKNQMNRLAMFDFIKADWQEDELLKIDTSKYNTLQSKYYDVLNINAKLIENKKIADIVFVLPFLEELEKQRTANKNAFTTEYLNTLFCVATNLSYGGEFEQADIYFNKLFVVATKDNFANYVHALFDYATNLNKLKQYEKGLQVLNSIDKTVLQQNQIWQTFYDAKILMCYIGLKDIVSLYALMQKKSSEKSPFQKIYNRFGICCVHILNNNFSEAEKEMSNIIRTKLLNVTLYEFVPLTDFFQFVLKQYAKYNHASLIPEKIKNEIKMQMFAIETQMFERIKGYFPYLIFVELLNLKQL